MDPEKINSGRTDRGELPPSRDLRADTVAGQPSSREAVRGLVPFGILIVVVVAATGPWSHLSSYNFAKPAVTRGP